MEKARETSANRELSEFGEAMLFRPMTKTKYNKENKLDVRCQYGLFRGVATRSNESMVSGPDRNERARKFRRLPEERRMQKR